MKATRDTKRHNREANNIPSVAIAGYTNAGKSSLLNRLTGAGVLVENALFATLDPTVAGPRPTTACPTRSPTRSASCVPSDAARRGVPIPLEEVSDADLLLHVVDGSHPDPEGQISRSGASCPMSAPPTSRRSSSSTRRTRPTPRSSTGSSATSGTIVVSARTGQGARCFAISSRVSCPGPTSRSRPSSRTAAATWSAGCTKSEVLTTEHREDGTFVREGAPAAAGRARGIPGLNSSWCLAPEFRVVQSTNRQRRGRVCGVTLSGSGRPQPEPSVEHARLAEAPDDSDPWRLWGPYVSGRQWGTVREDYSADGDAWSSFPFDQAHRRAYRWGEDGIAGLCDRYGFLNLAVAMWNGPGRPAQGAALRADQPGGQPR